MSTKWPAPGVLGPAIVVATGTSIANLGWAERRGGKHPLGDALDQAAPTTMPAAAPNVTDLDGRSSLACTDFEPLIAVLKACNRSVDHSRLRTAIAIVLLGVLRQPGVRPPLFLACARAFGITQHATDRELSCRLRQQLLVVQRVQHLAEPADCRLAALMHRICAAGKHAHRLREIALGREFGVDPAHLGRCLHAETGLTFRGWCGAISLGLALPLLIDSRESLKFIADEAGFQVTGTKQLARCVRRAFDLTPRQLRRAIRRLRTDPLWTSLSAPHARNVLFTQVLSPVFK